VSELSGREEQHKRGELSGRDEQQRPPVPVSAIAGITGWVHKTDEPYSRSKQAHQGDGNENQLCVCMYVWWGSSMKA